MTRETLLEGFRKLKDHPGAVHVRMSRQDGVFSYRCEICEVDLSVDPGGPEEAAFDTFIAESLAFLETHKHLN